MITNYNQFLFELNFNLIPCEYTKSKMIEQGREIETFKFETKKGNSYSVYFMLTTEDDELLSNGKYLSDYTQLNQIPTIFFSLTDRKFDKTFNDLTNDNEKFEVIGKVSYIIREYMNENEYTAYSIGGVYQKKMNFYNNYINHFNDFISVKGETLAYPNSNGGKTVCTYLVK